MPSTCCFRAEIGRPREWKKKCEQGEVFVKYFSVKKACVGDGGQRKCSLDDVFGIWVTVRSCCEKRIETKLFKSRLISLTVAKVFENKFGQVVEKPSDHSVCLFGFAKATKFRDSSECSQCLGTGLALQCYAGFVSSSFPSKIA